MIKETVNSITEMEFRRKVHRGSELFQTSSKTGLELIELAKEIEEMKNNKEVDIMKKSMLRKKL